MRSSKHLQGILEVTVVSLIPSRLFDLTGLQLVSLEAFHQVGPVGGRFWTGSSFCSLWPLKVNRFPQAQPYLDVLVKLGDEAENVGVSSFIPEKWQGSIPTFTCIPPSLLKQDLSVVLSNGEPT